MCRLDDEKADVRRCNMNMKKIYNEEDMFPREFTTWEERAYGYLFYHEENKDSYDSNHALIYKEKITDLKQTLEEITQFYTEKGMTPILYQSISDDGYFEEIKQELLKNGFDSWMETQNYMVLSEKNVIVPNQEVVVQKVSTWKDEYAVEIFEKAEEPWEIAVAKKMIENSKTLFFVASYQGKPVGMLYGHVKEDVCRGDYMLVSKEARNIGVGRTLMNSFVTYCNENQIKNCFLWPDGETAERIYYEAGFRYVETKKAGRAVYRRDSRIAGE